MVKCFLLRLVVMVLIGRFSMCPIKALRLQRILIPGQQRMVETVDGRCTRFSLKSGFSCWILRVRVSPEIMIERDVFLKDDDDMFNGIGCVAGSPIRFGMFLSIKGVDERNGCNHGCQTGFMNRSH